MRLLTLFIVGMGLCQCGLRAAPAAMDGDLTMAISVNGYTNPPPTPAGSTVTVAISVSPGKYEGRMADWWVVARGPHGWYYLQPEGWTPLAELSALQPARQQPLCAVQDHVIFSGSDLPAGAYACHFGLGEAGAGPSRVVSVDFEVVQTSAWSILCYMAADNNLEPDFLTKFLDLAQGGGDANVTLLAQLDRGGYATNFDGWTGCERFVITNGIRPILADAVADWGDGCGGREVNMGDPATLKSFLEWGMARHPARHYVLIMGNHGFGWRGLCIDYSHGAQTMFIRELGSVLSAAPYPVEIVLLDACLMQTFEALYDLHLAGVAYALGSQNYSQSDWPYRDMLDGLFRNPTWRAADAAVDIHDRLARHYAQNPDITLALTDLTAIPDLMAHTQLLAAGMIEPDLPLAALQEHAQSVMTGIDRAIIAEYHGANWADVAHGVSIYFPVREFDFVFHAPDSFDFYTPALCSFAGSTWRDFLALYFTGNADQAGRRIRGDIIDIRANMPRGFDQQQEELDLYGFCAHIAGYAP